MKHLLLLTLLILITSGCTSETGLVTDVPNPHDDYEEYVISGQRDLCDGVDCDITTKTCPDGFQVSCRDKCDPYTGNCISCEPLCTGHEIHKDPETPADQGPQTSQEEPAEQETDECSLTCRACQTLSDECECITKLNCDGNGICEQGEYPEGQDCEPCPENTECTSYTFDYSIQRCVPEDTCCGNGECDSSETELTCPDDCFQEEGDIQILSVNEIDEWVEIEGYGFLLNGWSLKDTTESNIYSFPEGFEINGKVKIHTGTGTDTAGDLYWGRDCPSNPFRCVWNNNGDTSYLLDEEQTVISEYSY